MPPNQHRKDRIEKLLNDQFHPQHLDVINESPLHHVGEAVETHFKIIMVSEAFKGQRLIERHRRVQTPIKPEFDTGLHALTLQLFTPEEWERSTPTPSPACRGGFHGG